MQALVDAVEERLVVDVLALVQHGFLLANILWLHVLFLLQLLLAFLLTLFLDV